MAARPSENIPVDWKLKNLDFNETLLPPYPVSEGGVRVSGGATLAEQARFGFQDPIVQWVGGKAKTITFDTVMFAVFHTDKIASDLKKFERLKEKDDVLGRAPICVFTLGSGSILSETCMVEAVDIDIMPVRRDGEPRHVTLSFTLKRYRPFSQTQIDPTKPGKESYFFVATTAEASYEKIAKRYYGQPLKGDRLRKRHPDMPFTPTVGRRIKIPAKSVILREAVVPAFHANHLTNEAATARFEEILDDRNSRKVVI